MITYLIHNLDTDINFPTDDSRTPLHLIAGRGDLRIISQFIEVYGADYSLLDFEGHSALYYAAMNNHDMKVIRYLAVRTGFQKEQRFGEVKLRSLLVWLIVIIFLSVFLFFPVDGI